MSDYCNLHWYPKPNRSCFIWNEIKNFCEKNNINLVSCTVGDHRSNGVIEHLIYTVKAKVLAMSSNKAKPTLNAAIDKIISNLRSTKQPFIGCSPFCEHFNRSPNTFWKSLVSRAIGLDKGKSILSKERAQDWISNDTTEDGYLEEMIPDSRGYEKDPTYKNRSSRTESPIII